MYIPEKAWRARGKFLCIFVSWRLFIMEGCQPTEPRTSNIQLVFREKAKPVLQLHLCSALREATLQTRSPFGELPQSPKVILRAPGDPRVADRVFVISFFGQFPPFSPSSLLTGRNVFSLPKFFPPKKGLCARGVVCCVESWKTALGAS